MGPWNSDGIFGYESVPTLAVERAAEAVGSPTLLVALPRLRTPECTEAFIELLNDVGRFWSRELFAPTGNSRSGPINPCR